MDDNRDTVLSLREYGVAFGDRIILSSVTMDIKSPGVTVLMGPAGTGKSTLLRSIVGINNASPAFRSWGDATYAGEPLGESGYPALVAQNARLLMSTVMENILSELPEQGNLNKRQKRDLAIRLLNDAGLEDLVEVIDQPVVDLPPGIARHLSVARTAVSRPPLLCVDEPTTGLDDASTDRLIKYLRSLGHKQAVLVVLHNQKQAKSLGGDTALLAGGWIQEVAPTDVFFGAPVSQLAQDFVRTGSCSAPSPDAKPEELDEEANATFREPPPAADQAIKNASSAFLGPRGFMWLKKGQLAGTPMPGVVQPIEHDLEALERVGVDTLISLTSKPLREKDLEGHAIECVWMPISDMDAPRLGNAFSMCERVAGLLEEGRVVAYHCRAGLGRTGTMLACQLIWEGYGALEALEAVRAVEPRWVQSEIQVDFLEKFHKVMQLHRRRQAKPAEPTNATNTAGVQ